MLKKPTFPVWRIHLTLYPLFHPEDHSILSGYRVIAERINLSAKLYDALSKEMGKENVDSELNNKQPSDRHTLTYYIAMATHYVSEETKYETFDTLNTPCGLQLNCMQQWKEDEGDWGKGSVVTLPKAPWESTLNPLPAMVRTLGKQAGWVQENGLKIESWDTPEIPEGMSDKNPWIDIVIENYTGNGGGYLMEWHSLVSDDSIKKTLYRVFYDEASHTDKAMVYTSVLCHRNKNTLQPTQICK
jgi:hypothetical protein